MSPCALDPQAVELVLQSCPQATLDYCLSFFSGGVAEWARLLETLLERVSATGQQQPQLQQVYRAAYKSGCGLWVWF